jgi:hypothetical protein
VAIRNAIVITIPSVVVTEWRDGHRHDRHGVGREARDTVYTSDPGDFEALRRGVPAFAGVQIVKV